MLTIKATHTDERQLRHSRDWRSFSAKPRLYVSPEDETVLENLLGGRQNRPVAAYRRLLPEVFRRLGIEGATARWSRTAGCGCGCSPGFVLDLPSGPRPVDYFVTVGVVADAPATIEDEADEVAAAGDEQAPRRRRNYRAMLDGNLLTAIFELERGGEAYDRCLSRGSGDPLADLRVARDEAARRDLISAAVAA